MGAEKHGSKSGGGGYVGGLLQLFDWNAKSRKKLFSSKSTIPGKLKSMVMVVLNGIHHMSSFVYSYFSPPIQPG